MNAYYSPLENEALLHIEGPDSLKFLQGQTSCDTRQIDATHSLPGTFSTPKGRMICEFQLAELGPEQFALRMRQDILESSKTAFGKYIIFSKAQLSTEQQGWQVFACWGEQVTDSLSELITADLPTQINGSTLGEGFVLLQLDEAAQQFELWINPALNAELLEQVQAQLQLQAIGQWQALRIRAGIARLEAETVEEFLPQMLNYDLTGFISFNKGCYTGQEIIARLHYRGKAKRRMYLASIDDITELPAAGTELFSQDSSQSVGNIINACVTEEQMLCLCNSTEAGLASGLHLGSPEGPLLTIGELPYALDN